MALKSKFLRTNVLKSRGMRQHYHGFSPFIPLKTIFMQSSFARINFQSFLLLKHTKCLLKKYQYCEFILLTFFEKNRIIYINIIIMR